MKINENALAKAVAEVEAGRIGVNIAQIKEILEVTFDMLANDYLLSEVLALIEKHAK